MGKKRNKNMEQVVALIAELNHLQAEYELFLENSSYTQDPENHEKNLKRYIRKIVQLKKKIAMLSK